MPDMIIEAVDIEYAYSTGTKALKGLSMGIPKGKKIAILGANGAGKSTAFLHFNGILKPHKGCIKFKGKEISYKRSDLMELRKEVGIVFQDPDSQLFSGSVLQEISFGPMNLGLSKEEVKRRVYRAMDATGIRDLEHRPTHFLSFGQKKRVAIADILAMEPEVIILDEPTAWLDPKHTAGIMNLMDEMNQEGKTVILSTHEVDIAYAWADYIYVFNDGKVIGFGTPPEIFSNDQILREANLTKPIVYELFEELLNRNMLIQEAGIPRNKDELFSMIKNEKKLERNLA